MPTTDLDGSAGWAGWLQSLLANQGASQPYGPGATPSGAGPQGLMPGGGVMGYPAATPGQPSMGYPAVGQAAGRPSVAPGTQAPGAQNPILSALNAFNPISSAQAAETTPSVWSMRHGMPDDPDIGGLVSGILNAASQGGPTDAGDLVGAGDTSLRPGPSILPQARGRAVPAWPAAPTTDPASRNMPFPQDLGPAGRNMPYPGQTDPRSYYAPPPGPLASPATAAPAGSAAGPMDPSIIARQKMAASPAATSTAAPAAAPAAAASNPRFGTFQYQTPNSSASRAPIYTALNLGGGGQPAANPNVPAANAQPVASAAAPNVPSNAPSNYGPLQQGNNIWDILSKAPWNYGPLQQNNIWGGSGGPQR